MGASCGKGVHGDARDANVLCTTDTGHFVFVDFDWAGLHNKATYRYGLHYYDVRWPMGVTDGAPMHGLQEHDVELLRRSAQQQWPQSRAYIDIQCHIVQINKHLRTP